MLFFCWGNVFYYNLHLYGVFFKFIARADYFWFGLGLSWEDSLINPKSSIDFIGILFIVVDSIFRGEGPSRNTRSCQSVRSHSMLKKFLYLCQFNSDFL